MRSIKGEILEKKQSDESEIRREIARANECSKLAGQLDKLRVKGFLGLYPFLEPAFDQSHRGNKTRRCDRLARRRVRRASASGTSWPLARNRRIK